MKKLATIAIAVALTGTLMLQSGCYGSFALVKKLYEWNGSVSNDKFARSLVFWVLTIIPVYEAAAFIDAVFLNLIEFWSGSNPVSMKEGQHEEQVVVKDGVAYRMEATKNKLSITPLAGSKKGQKVEFNFDEHAMSWSCTSNGQTNTLAKLQRTEAGEAYATIFSAKGKSVNIAAPADETSLANAMQALHHLENVAVH